MARSFQKINRERFLVYKDSSSRNLSLFIMSPRKHWIFIQMRFPFFDGNGERFLDFEWKWGRISRRQKAKESYPQRYLHVINRIIHIILSRLSNVAYTDESEPPNMMAGAIIRPRADFSICS